MSLDERLRVKPGSAADLASRDPADTLGMEKAQAESHLEASREKLAKLHELLWADNSRALLLILQGMDTSGKDGAIRHVMSGVNPQGCTVTSFKQPTPEELDHDFLWRIHKNVPARGDIGIFNRSHYEDVLVVRVHGLVPKETWSARYRQINDFERMLTENGVAVLKCFLHISKDEQAERLQARLDDPTKNWKFSEGDLAERARWDQYIEAYEEALTRCSTEEAPWHIIPADRKWIRNAAVSRLVVKTLESFKLRWPKPKLDLRRIRVE